MKRATRPVAPADLAAKGRGRRFWAEVVRTFRLRPDELRVLEEACRQLDLVDALRAVVADEGLTTTGSRGQVVVHPAVVELRQVRQELRRSLAQLELPDEDERRGQPNTSGSALKAAAARWGRGAG